MKDYLELSIKTTHDGAELVADILSEYTDLGVNVVDSNDVKELEKSGIFWDYIEDGAISNQDFVTVKTSFKLETAQEVVKEIELRLKALKETGFIDFGSLEIETQEIDGEMWREKWKENFKPIRIKNLTIVPEWMEYKRAKDEKIVLLNSNMAFGTGEHETTFMCLDYLTKYVKPNSVVLDVGCGSGILGISACKLGAKEVLMTDIDECAIVATNQNLELNKVTNGKALLKNLLDDNTVKGDIIVCNIMAEVLISFAKNLKNNIVEGGIVILSGILNDRLDKVVNEYQAQGFRLIEKNTLGEWSACVLERQK